MKMASKRAHSLAVIPGDGIGVEVVGAAEKLLHRVGEVHGFGLDLETYDLGADRYLRTGEILPERVLAELADHEAILFGAMGRPDIQPGVLERGFILRLRREFQQYVNLRPVRTILTDGGPATGKRCDLAIVRENLEGLYGGVGGVSYFETTDEIAVQSSINTYGGVRRIVEYAFELATGRHGKVSVCHKSNVLTHAGGLWTRMAAAVGDEYPHVAHNYVNVDAAGLHLVADPERFDVIVTDSMFGDILSDVAAAMVGGLGFAGSGNIDPTRKYPSMFEPIHGSAPDIAGMRLANPVGAFLAVQLLLEHIGENEAASSIGSAVDRASAGFALSRAGIGAGTDEVTEAVLACVA